MELEEFIQQHVEIIKPLQIRSKKAWWDLATTGDPIHAKQFEECQIALRKVYSSKDEYQYLQSHQKHPDPLVSRQAYLLLNEYTENQIPFDCIEELTRMETEIESIYTNFRPTVGDKSLSNNDIKDILVGSQDPDLRKNAWEASKRIGEQVSDKVLKLVALRNQCARQIGFPDYYSMRLELQELDENRLFQIIDELDKATVPFWKQYKSQLDETLSQMHGVSVNVLKPWHYHDPFFQEAPQGGLNFDRVYSGKNIVEISRTFYDSIGLPVDDILARSDLFERKDKNQHAFCTCIDRSQDVRILCNIRDKEYWMGTQLHELGHAVYDKYIDQTLPYLLRTPAHISTTEAIAMLFGRLSKNSHFIQQYCSSDFADADNLAKKQLSDNLLVFARWTMVMIHFERALYQQPESDLNQLWWDYVEKFQWVKKDPSRNAPDWAAKLHLACVPVYYQNYILGEMTASQLLHGNESFSPDTGERLKTQLFNLGAKYPWEETLLKATGTRLDPRHFIADLTQTQRVWRGC